MRTCYPVPMSAISARSRTRPWAATCRCTISAILATPPSARPTNIGAGAITMNYDGKEKHHTEIGDRAFIGCDTLLRAPIVIGADAATGAGSVVTRDVPPGMLAVGMPARITRHTQMSVDASSLPANDTEVNENSVARRHEETE